MTDLAGFDVCFAIGATGVGQALQSQLQPVARPAVRGIPLALPNSPSSTLDVNLEFQPASTISAGQVEVVATGTGDLRMGVNGQSLVTLPVTGGTLPGALASVPVSVSGIRFRAAFLLTVARAGAVRQVTIGRTSVTVTTPDFPGTPDAPNDVEAFRTALRDDLTAQLNTILAGAGTIDTGQVTNTVNALVTAIPGAIIQVVRQRLEGLFPIPINFTLPAVDPNVFCNIGLRDVQVALLAGDAGAGTAPCLAIATTLLPGSTGTLGNLRSPLPTAEAAGLFFDNHFLISAICCGIRNAPQFRELPAPTTEPVRGEDNACCTWTGINVLSVMEGRRFRVRRASLCLDQSDENNKRFVMTLRLTTSDTGWTATVDVTADITLSISNGVVVPRIGQPVVDVTVDFEWWVVLVAVLLVAIVALLVAVLVGVIVGAIAVVVGAAASAAAAGLIGAGIAGAIVVVLGIIIGIAVNDALKNNIAEDLRAAVSTVQGGLQGLRVVPDELQEAFGRLDAARLVFDDLQIFGRPFVNPPVDERPLFVVSDLILPAGHGIDLDHGTTLLPTDPDCDLVWRRFAPSPFLVATGLAASGAAALARVTGVRYDALSLAALRRLAFPKTGGFIESSAVPTEGELPFLGVAALRLGSAKVSNTVVFGVRTGEGRYARGAASQDDKGNLHLSYTVFDTPAPLRLRATWNVRRTRPRLTTAIARPRPGGELPGGGELPEWDVVRTCTLQAIPISLQGPVTYAWTWNGKPLATGQGPLPGGIASVQITGSKCVLTGQEGTDISGEICVRATDMFGVPAQVCRDLVGTGTEPVFEPLPPVVGPIRPVVPRPNPLLIGGRPPILERAAPTELEAPAPDLASQLLDQLEELAKSG